MAVPSAAAPLSRTFYLRRRTLAAVFAFLAVLTGLLALRPPEGASVEVLSAARGLPAGTVVAAHDLVRVRLPPGATPDHALTDDAEAIGRTLTGPLDRGAPLTRASVAGPERLSRPGHLVVSLPLHNDGIAALVRPGVRLDLIASDGATVAAEVPVVGPATDAGDGLVRGSARTALVEVPEEVAARLAGQGGGVTVAVR